MKKFIITFIIFCSGKFVSAQPNDESMITPFWDFYSDNHLSAVATGKGITGIASKNDISGILLNPASLNFESKDQLHAGTIYKSNVPWLPSLNISDLSLREVYPTIFGGFGYKINKNFQTGFVYHNNSSFLFNLGEVIRTNEFGEVLDRYEAYIRLNVHSFTVPLVVNYNIMSFGFSVTYSLFTGYANAVTTPSNPEGTEAKASFGKFIPQFGMQILPTNNLAFGLFLMPGFTQSIEWKTGNGSVSTSNPHSFPLKLGVGSELRLKYFNLSLDYNYAHTSADYRLKDRHDFHFGMEYPVDEKWTVRSGFYSQKDYRSDNVVWLDAPGSYDQIFITLGGSLKLKNSTFNLSVMDSHLFSSGLIKKTQVTGSFSYNF